MPKPSASAARAVETRVLEGVEGAGAMRDCIFGCRLHLAESQLMTVGDEDRIIAETVLPARRPNDMTVNFAFKQLGFAVRPGKAEHRDEVGPERLAFPAPPGRELVVDALHGDGEIPARTGP